MSWLVVILTGTLRINLIYIPVSIEQASLQVGGAYCSLWRTTAKYWNPRWASFLFLNVVYCASPDTCYDLHYLWKSHWGSNVCCVMLWKILSRITPTMTLLVKSSFEAVLNHLETCVIYGHTFLVRHVNNTHYRENNCARFQLQGFVRLPLQWPIGFAHLPWWQQNLIGWRFYAPRCDLHAKLWPTKFCDDAINFEMTKFLYIYLRHLKAPSLQKKI